MSRTSFVFAVVSMLAFANATAPSGSASALAFSTVEQELSEDDALDRFEIDEWFLPKLNIELRALFDWSSADSAYYASARQGAGERTIDLC